MRKAAYLALIVIGLAAGCGARANHAVNINIASLAELDSLPEIGATLAQRIIDYRNGASGPYDTIEEIQNVSGIGTATYDAIKDHITVGGTSTPPPAETAATTTVTETPSPPPVHGGYAPATVTVEIEGGARVPAGAGAVFDAALFASNGDQLVSGGRFLWSFGDGGSAEGKHVFHTYEYPGAYVVVLSAGYSYSSASDRMTVVVFAPSLQLVAEGDGSLTILNKGKEEIDIGGWTLRDGNAFVIPEDTIVLAGMGVRFAPAATGLPGSRAAELFFPNGARAATAAVGASSPLRGTQVAAAQMVPQKSSGLLSEPKNGSTGQTFAPPSAPSVPLAAAVATSNGIPSALWLSSAGLVVVLLLGVAGVYYGRVTNAPKEEFEIDA